MLIGPTGLILFNIIILLNFAVASQLLQGLTWLETTLEV